MGLNVPKYSPIFIFHFLVLRMKYLVLRSILKIIKLNSIKLFLLELELKTPDYWLRIKSKDTTFPLPD
jgi:hypothetical protein